MKVAQLHPTLCDPLYSPWISAGQNTAVGSHSLLQGIFPTQGLNSSLPHCRKILYQLSHQGSPIAWKIFIPYWMSVCMCVCACVHLQPCVYVVCTCPASWFQFVLFCFRTFYPFSYTHTAAYVIMWFWSLRTLKMISLYKRENRESEMFPNITQLFRGPAQVCGSHAWWIPNKNYRRLEKQSEV